MSDERISEGCGCAMGVVVIVIAQLVLWGGLWLGRRFGLW